MDLLVELFEPLDTNYSMNNYLPIYQ